MLILKPRVILILGRKDVEMIKSLANFFLLLFVSLGIHGLYGQLKPFQAYEQRIAGSPISIELVPISGGSFTMGSPASEEGRSADEGPKHMVVVESFWMARYEITWDLYQLFLQRELDELQASSPEGQEVVLDVDGVAGATTPYLDMSFGMGTEGYPAVCMTQYAASKFCEWLSAMTGNFYRLPTEAEWEYACRAGSDKAYSFGEDAAELEKYAWFAENSGGKYQKVGLKEPNAWGLYDMHGNVSEWTLDQYISDIYKQRQKITENPFEKPVKIYPRSVRGGSWQDHTASLRSASRAFSDRRWKIRDPQFPKSKWWHTDAPFVGFRIVRPYRTPEPEDQKKFWLEKHIN